MRVVIQRVSEATLRVDDTVISSIGQGMLVLLGIHEHDSNEDLEWLVNKTVRLRIFDDAQGVMNLDVMQAGGELMVISQFTLQASTKKGNRPSYLAAMEPVSAEKTVNDFIEKIENLAQKKVARGVFGAHMEISLVNNGPVTIIMDSKNREL